MRSRFLKVVPLVMTCLLPLAAQAASAPVVVFIGDQFTYSWGNSPGAFPSNWINKGWNGSPGGTPCPLECDYGTSGATAERFKTDVIALHPAIVHIMVGADDADTDSDASQRTDWPDYLSNIQTMVSMAHEANIHVILGLEPTGWGFRAMAVWMLRIQSPRSTAIKSEPRS